MDKGPIRSLIARPLNRGEDGIFIKEVVNFSSWDWQNFSFSFPTQLALEIKATPISFSASNSGRISWSSSPNGIFDLKDAYKLASSQEGDFNSGMIDGEWVWKVATIPKIQCLFGNVFIVAFL